MEKYNKSRMSIQTYYNCGLCFIKTGTSSSFQKWINNDNLTKYTIPIVLAERIKYFIDREDRDSASTLWLKVCQHLEQRKKKLPISILLILIYLLTIFSFIIFT